ncbi:MAG: HAD-IB family hydrolase [Acidobacteria bacterium]|nr:HAD-IB family hydrolase [Acidobacteriota bacterium]
MHTRTLALFDLDETLLAGDSDYEWGQFLVDEGVLDRSVYEARNKEFYERYRAGTLDLQEFLDFQLKPLSWFSREKLDAWHRGFMATRILPIIRPGARALLDRHRDDVRVIITATNRFVTEPIAQALGVTNLVATELEALDGRYTGRPRGTPCFREGKVQRLGEWLAERGERLADYEQSWFYSDSMNDAPLLSLVTNPVAVHPDDRLRARAEQAGWPVISLD